MAIHLFHSQWTCPGNRGGLVQNGARVSPVPGGRCPQGAGRERVQSQEGRGLLLGNSVVPWGLTESPLGCPSLC